jgi:protein gp37
MKETPIEWCDSTVNGSSGCNGCELWNAKSHLCYAGKTHEGRWGHSLAITHPQFYSKSFSEVKMIPGRFAMAASWSDLRGKNRPDKPWLNGLPRLIFVGDMGDFLSREVTDEFLWNELFAAINSKQGQRHFWLLLTKQISRLKSLSERMGGLPFNSMAMTTATDQATANFRVRELIEVDCEWRGLSCEPILGPIDLTHLRDREDELFNLNGLTGEWIADGMNEPVLTSSLDWVIGGFASGDEAPVPDADCAVGLRNQCQQFEVPFFFKQWGEWAPDFAILNLDKVMGREHAYSGRQFFGRVGKKGSQAVFSHGGPMVRQMPDLPIFSRDVSASST